MTGPDGACSVRPHHPGNPGPTPACIFYLQLIHLSSAEGERNMVTDKCLSIRCAKYTAGRTCNSIENQSPATPCVP